MTQDRQVVESNVATLCDFLEQGFMPVLHGDCVRDTVRGCIILSGDTVIKVDFGLLHCLAVLLPFLEFSSFYNKNLFL